MKKKHWIIIGLVVVAIVAFSLLAKKRNRLEIAYKDVVIENGDLEVTILATGTVQPENRLEIKPPVPGRIEEVLTKEGQVVKRGDVLAWMSSTERAALLDAARSQGPKELKKWEKNYRATPILAPIDGTIILRNVEAGQTFTSSDPVFVMSDRLTVKAQVDETDIAQIKLGQKATITLDAYPKDKIRGKVDQIAFDAKTVNNVTTYDIDVLPETKPEYMRSGMTANVTFLVTAKEDILTVPNAALKTKDSKYSVMVKVNGETQEKNVEVGISDGKRTEIVSGLTEGDTIVIAEIKPGKGKSSQGTNPFAPAGGMGRGGRR